MNLIDFSKYNNILNNNKYKDINYYGNKNNDIENEFWIDLIKLSKSRCYYCGDIISIHNYEREHRIDKKILGELEIIKENDSDEIKKDKKIKNHIIEEIKKSKYNLIPCCRLCNSRKKLVNPDLVSKKLLEVGERKYPNKILSSKSDVDLILGESNFLTEKIDIDWIHFELKNDFHKSKCLRFKEKIIDTIERLIERNWIYSESFLEELLICNQNRDYLVFVYDLFYLSIEQ